MCAVTVLMLLVDGCQVEQALRERDTAFSDPTLPLLEFDDIMASIGDKLPLTLSEALYGMLEANAEVSVLSQVSMYLYVVALMTSCNDKGHL